MRNWKKSLATYKERTSLEIKDNLKKIVVSVITAGSICFAGVLAAAAADNQLMTVYYVYADGQYIGTVSDRAVIEDFVQEEASEKQSVYAGMELVIGSEINYIPEQVFKATVEIDDQNVIKKLENELSIAVNGFTISIDGEQTVYLENQAQAEEVLKIIKSKYVTEAQLAEAEVHKASSRDLDPLKENESRIIDVYLKEKVSVSSEKFGPEKILSVEDAVKLLEKGTLEEKKYTVREGEVLGSIAQKHQLSTAELLTLNPGLTAESIIKIGDELNVTVLQPYVNVVVEKEVMKTESIAFEKEVIEDSSMFKGDTKVKQEGKQGISNITYRMTESNGQLLAKEVTAEKVMKEPVKHIVIKGTKVIPSRGDGSFVWPASGGYISSKMGYRWGKMHKGIDIARPSSGGIKAADNGIVVSAGWDGGYGNKIVIDHQNGYRTVYAHLSSLSVSAGQTVSKGTQIGMMGSTGDSTGVHLHFEVYKNGNLENPLNYLR